MKISFFELQTRSEDNSVAYLVTRNFFFRILTIVSQVQKKMRLKSLKILQSVYLYSYPSLRQCLMARNKSFCLFGLLNYIVR